MSALRTVAPLPAACETGATPTAPTPLRDPYGRAITYLRVSVTTRCNLRCTYCAAGTATADAGVPLSFDQIARVVRVAAALGVTKIKLTGGEPLLRDGLPDLVARLARIPGIRDVSLTTNGQLLAAHAVALHAAGLHRVTVALDTLDPAVYRALTGGDLAPVLDGITAALRLFGEVRINCVVMAGVNDTGICTLVDYCLAHGCTLRFLEVMPTAMGDDKRHFVSNDIVRERIAAHVALTPCPSAAEPGTAVWHAVAGVRARIGFISPLSQPFCSTCNRLRLTADGELLPCLHSAARVPLRPLLEGGADDVALAAVLRAAAAQKPAAHALHCAPSCCNMLCTGG
jgi:cyclic pyranopterin phosphate synthase